jgi:hypothetical protein
MRTSVLVMVSLLVIAPYGRPQDSVVKSGTVLVPAGTTLFVRLERSISTRSAKPGDQIYLQTAHPVVVKNEVVIPAGTYVEGTLDTIVGRGWINRRLELRLHVTRFMFANGYVVAASDPMQGISGSSAGIRSDGQRVSPASVTSNAAPAAGMAIGALGDGARGAAVGGGIGSAVGALATVLAIRSGEDVTADAGSTLDLVLQNPLTLDERRATAPASIVMYALPRAEEQHERRCYSPGMPGTPDVIIPGMPGAPAMGDIPATPPSPPTFVPGTPATAGYSYRCN